MGDRYEVLDEVIPPPPGLGQSEPAQPTGLLDPPGLGLASQEPGLEELQHLAGVAAQLKTAVGESEDAEEEQAGLVNSLSFSRTLEIPPTQAYEIKDQIAQELTGDERVSQKGFFPRLLDTVKSGARSGYEGLQAGLLAEKLYDEAFQMSVEALAGNWSTQRWNTIEQLEAQISGLAPGEDSDFLHGVVWDVGQIIPGIIGSMREGAIAGAGTAAVGALAGLGAGGVGAGPGAAGGFLFGFGAGVASYSFKQARGRSWLTLSRMRDRNGEPIPQWLVQLVSATFGAANAAVETVQLGQLAETIPGVQQVLSKAMGRRMDKVLRDGTVGRLILERLEAFGRYWTREVSEELIQELFDITGEGLAVDLSSYISSRRAVLADPRSNPRLASVMASGQLPAELVPSQGAYEALVQDARRLANTFIHSAPALAILGIPGHVMGGAADIRELAQQRRAVQLQAETPVTLSPLEQVVSEAKSLLSQPEQLTPKKAERTLAKLDAVVENPEARPEEVVRAAEVADAVDRELEILPGVKAQSPEAQAEALRIIAGGLKEAEVQEIQEEIQLAREAGIENAEDFARDMKAVEIPGQEKPAELYRQQFEQTPQTKADEEAQRFLEGLSKEDVENQVLEAVSNPNVPPEALKLLAPIYRKITTEGTLSEETYGELIRKMATTPRKWKEAFERALTEETADYEGARRFEAALQRRLPKQPGEGLEPYRPLNVADVMQQKDKKELEPVRERIAQIVHTALKPPSAAINYEEAMKIQDLQEGVDPRASKRLVKTQERLRHYYATHPNESPSADTRRFLEKRFLGSMSYGELETFDKQIRDLRGEGRLKRSMAFLEERKIVAKAQEGIKIEILKRPFEGMRGKGSLTAEKKMRGSPKSFVQAYTLNMLRLAQMMGPTAETWLTTEVNKTLDVELRAVDRIAEPAKAKLKELGITAKDLAQPLETKDGVRYTVDQVIHMYLAIKNEDERATLIHGNKVSGEEVAQLIKQLTPQQRAWGDYMLSVFAGDNFERLNRAYIEDKNRASHKVENYFPIRAREGTYDAIAQEISSDLLTRAGARRGYPSKGFLIERMNIADEHRRPMRLGATAIFFEQIEKQEHYISHWQLARRLQNIFTRDRNLVEAIASRFGRDWNKAINTYINEVANPGAFRANELRMPLMDALRSNVTLGALAFNINSLLNNLTGPMLYLADAGPLHMMSAAAQWVRHPVALYEFVTERDPQVKHASMDPVLENIRRRFGQNAFQQYQDFVVKIGMKPLEAIDMWTRLIGWKAVYDKSIAAKMSEAEAIQAAQKSTLRTQPSGRLKDLPLMYQDRAAHMFLMFTRQLNQIWNMVTADMPMDIRQGKILHALADALALSLTGLGIGLIGRKRPPEDLKEWTLDLIGQYISGIPLVGNDVLTGLQGYWWSGRGVNLIPGVARVALAAGKQIKEGGDLQDWADAFLAVTPELMKMLGLPGVAAGRIIHLIETGDPWELLGGRR